MHSADKRCTECGLEESAWDAHHGEGYLLQGEYYCCQGCAEGLGCLCRDALLDVDVEDPDSRHGARKQPPPETFNQDVP